MIRLPQKQSIRVFTLVAVLLSGTTALPMQGDAVRRVRFARGRTTAVLRGAIVNDSMNRYVLGAKGGQTMTAHITSPGNKARFDVSLRGDRSELVSTGAEDTTDWEGTLPVSGDYVISVYSVGGNTRYTLEVTIR